MKLLLSLILPLLLTLTALRAEAAFITLSGSFTMEDASNTVGTIEIKLDDFFYTGVGDETFYGNESIWDIKFINYDGASSILSIDSLGFSSPPPSPEYLGLSVTFTDGKLTGIFGFETSIFSGIHDYISMNGTSFKYTVVEGGSPGIFTTGNLNLSSADISEPSIILVMSLGLIGIVGIRRQNFKRKC